MNKNLLTNLASITLMAVALSGCSSASKGNQTFDDSQRVETQAYLDGYNGNLGASPALVNDAGGPNNYCRSLLDLHPDYSKSDENDYLRGCLEVIGASDNESATEYEPAVSEDLLSRLQSAGGDNWSEDAFAPFSPPDGFRTDYLASGACTLWVFDDGEYADAAVQDGFLDSFYEYTYSWGTEDGGLGVIAMYEDENSACASDMLEVTGWGVWP